MSEKNTLVLTDLKYCWIIDNNTGKVNLLEGPNRTILGSNEEIKGKISDKIILEDGEYVNIRNPFDKEKKKILYGEIEQRIGPCIFSLYYGEEIIEDIKEEIILEKFEGLLMRAKKEIIEKKIINEEIENEISKNDSISIKTPSKEKIVEEKHNAGDVWIVEGPCSYIPHKHSEIIQKLKSIILGKDEGLYIKNIKTGEIHLEAGPKTIMLTQEEQLFQKKYTIREKRALESEIPEDTSRAIPLTLLKSEIMMIMKGDKQRVEIGPKTILLEPFENIYIMNISGNTPKERKKLYIWYVKLGPIFSSDELIVRTKDNAIIRIKLRYKWRFKIEKENLEKIFEVEDFIGLMTDTMASLIREETANYDFEKFHSNAREIIQKITFNENKSYIFEENGLEIFGIDIKEISPEDEDVEEAIKSNMSVFVEKIINTDKLNAERQLIEHKILLEQEKKQLITLEQENKQLKIISDSKIEANAEIEKAKGISEAIKLKSIENELKNKQFKDKIEAMGGGEIYSRIQQAQSYAETFKETEKIIIIPSSSDIIFPMDEEFWKKILKRDDKKNGKMQML